MKKIGVFCVCVEIHNADIIAIYQKVIEVLWCIFHCRKINFVTDIITKKPLKKLLLLSYWILATKTRDKACVSVKVISSITH